MKTPAVEEFEAATPAAEAEPLLMMRRALERFAEARYHAARVAALAEASPRDDRLARCAGHLAREAESARGLGAEAVSAWAGAATGRVEVGADEGDPWRVVVQAGDLAFVEVEAGKQGGAFDIAEAERSLVRRLIEAVVAPGPLRDRSIAHVDNPSRTDRLGGYLARGQTPGWYASTIVFIAESELRHEAEREEKDAAHAARSGVPRDRGGAG